MSIIRMLYIDLSFPLGALTIFFLTGNNIENSVDRSTSSETSQTPVKTKKLFVTGMLHL